MLDKDTKKKIDDARDILVGKVPDPKSQVEQITIALIYKFMDDMDNEAVEMDGKASFFTGKYAKYAWTKLFDKKLGSHEMLFLYTEALTQLPLHTGKDFPQLFRDIFKNAFLPYRDPETLKLFLKTINGFTYDHSERLGDAFEYLLSVLGSQGDAGQFRTPRNIIDFIVAVMDPKKNETICDTACGTAGFLISSYKHILEQNKKKNPGDLLKPDERRALVKNIRGYDISPDMVRLSLVNLYLHHFSNPQIVEYDTLTSEERWKESFDVIMANPPFMSPKGGITPHKRFKVTSNRSEVLFVDYIAEHINPVTGRAGVIVPEGIIFQSATAYKALRKMLVDNYLYAVVSLPAGVFNPYSGVKTSILLMDKAIAKKSNEILFIKIENDGFGLGAQRKGHDKNDLPDALQLLRQYKEAVHQGKAGELTLLPIALLVSKEKIGENGEYNLSAERYTIAVTSHNSGYALVSLGDKKYFNIESGGTPSTQNSAYWDGGIKWATLVDLPASDFITEIFDTQRKISKDGLDNSSAKIIPANSVIVSTRATIGRIAINKVDMATNQGFKNIVIKDAKSAIPEFVAYMITQLVPKMESMATGGTFKELSKSSFSQLQIPLPPLSIQQEIVNKIDGWQKIIDGAKQVMENYKPQIDIDPEWEMVELGEVVNFKTGKLNANAAIENGAYPFFTCSKDIFRINQYSFDCEAILLSGNNASGDFDVKYYSGKFDAYQRTYVITVKNANQLSYLFLQTFLQSKLIELKNKSIGGLTRYLTLPMLTSLRMALPEIQTQKKIITQIEKEQALVNANKELAAIYEQKIKDEINKLWQGEGEKQKGSKKKVMETA